MYEAITITRQNGYDPRPVVEMLTSTLFSAPIYQSYGKRLAEQATPPMQSPIPLKDIGLFETTARQVDMPTPIANLLHSILEQEQGEA